MNKTAQRTALSIAVAFACSSWSAYTFAGVAVSGVNGKVELVAGDVDSSSATALSGSIAFPVANNWGAQIDAASGKIGGDSLSGLGGHFFWRDSDIGLIGLTAMSAKLGGIDVDRVGVEGEYYHNQWTFSGALGDLGGDMKGSYAGANVSYYYSGNLMIEAGLSKADNEDHYHLGLESMPFDGAFENLSLFADLSGGNNGYDHALVGIKYYFGKKKNLIKRHREDDPINACFWFFSRRALKPIAEAKTGGGAGAEVEDLDPLEEDDLH